MEYIILQRSITVTLLNMRSHKRLGMWNEWSVTIVVGFFTRGLTGEGLWYLANFKKISGENPVSELSTRQQLTVTVWRQMWKRKKSCCIGFVLPD